MINSILAVVIHIIKSKKTFSKNHMNHTGWFEMRQQNSDDVIFTKSFLIFPNDYEKNYN